MAYSSNINGAVADIAKKDTKGMFKDAFPPTTPSKDAPPGPAAGFNPFKTGGQVGGSSTIGSSAPGAAPVLTPNPADSAPWAAGGSAQPVLTPNPADSAPWAAGGSARPVPVAVMPPGLNRLSRGAPAMGLGGTAPVRVGSGKSVGQRVLERQARRGNWRAASALFQSDITGQQTAAQKEMQKDQQQFTSGQNDMERAFNRWREEGGWRNANDIATTDRAARTQENAAQREFQANQSEMQRQFQAAQEAARRKEREETRKTQGTVTLIPIDEKNPDRGQMIKRGDGVIIGQAPKLPPQPGPQWSPDGTQVKMPGWEGTFTPKVTMRPAPPGGMLPPMLPDVRFEPTPKPAKPPEFKQDKDTGRYFYVEPDGKGGFIRKWVRDENGDGQPDMAGVGGGANPAAASAVGAALNKMKL